MVLALLWLVGVRLGVGLVVDILLAYRRKVAGSMLEVRLFECVSLSRSACCVVVCLFNLADLLGAWVGIGLNV